MGELISNSERDLPPARTFRKQPPPATAHPSARNQARNVPIPQDRSHCGPQALVRRLAPHQAHLSARETICALTTVIEARDGSTSAHSARVGWLARMLGEALGMPLSAQQNLEWAGLVHDIGKLEVPQEILDKSGPLAPAEFELLKRHPRISYEMLRPLHSLRPILDSVLYHHENWDGSGYLEGLRGKRIPIGARVLRVADMFDALSSNRSYRASLGIPRTLEKLTQSRGRAIDPHIGTLFVETFQCYMAQSRSDFKTRFAHVTDAGSTPPAVTSPAPSPPCPGPPPA
jgi:HD-GYP domain-containing protein (c-di-GMP phosphodiesterase class II)